VNTFLILVGFLSTLTLACRYHHSLNVIRAPIAENSCRCQVQGPCAVRLEWMPYPRCFANHGGAVAHHTLLTFIFRIAGGRALPELEKLTKGLPLIGRHR
jgi:hypothetical protein